MSIEAAGLPPGVRIRWFASLVARPLVLARSLDEVVPDGAIVWTDEPGGVVEAVRPFPGAAVVVPGEALVEGPETLAEPEPAAEVPDIRAAVADAVAALPAELRAGAAEQAEAALAAVGL